MVVGIVLTVGLIISVLSFYLLMLSIYLLLQKNTKKLENLLMIGFSPAAVARPYQVLTVGLNAAVAAMGVLLVCVARGAYLDMLQRMVPDFQGGSRGTFPAGIGAECAGRKAEGGIDLEKEIV